MYVLEFFNPVNLNPQMNKSLIALIEKVDNPGSNQWKMIDQNLKVKDSWTTKKDWNEEKLITLLYLQHY